MTVNNLDQEITCEGVFTDSGHDTKAVRSGNSIQVSTTE